MISSPSRQETLGRAISERRQELQMTQEELAARIGAGVRQSDVSRLERDRIALPRRARLEAIAVALDLPVGELLARSGWAGAGQAIVPSNAGARAAALPHKTVGEQPPRLHAPLREPVMAEFDRLRQACAKSTELIESYQLLEAPSVDLIAGHPASSRA